MLLQKSTKLIRQSPWTPCTHTIVLWHGIYRPSRHTERRALLSISDSQAPFCWSPLGNRFVQTINPVLTASMDKRGQCPSRRTKVCQNRNQNRIDCQQNYRNMFYVPHSRVKLLWFIVSIKSHLLSVYWSEKVSLSWYEGMANQSSNGSLHELLRTVNIVFLVICCHWQMKWYKQHVQIYRMSLSLT